MAELERLIGVDEVLALHGAIVGSIPPDEMARSLAFMLPAMNVDDRTELLGGMRMAAPPEAFDGRREPRAIGPHAGGLHRARRPPRPRLIRIVTSGV